MDLGADLIETAMAFSAPESRRELLAAVGDEGVILTEREPVDAELIARAPALVRIVKFGTDLRNVDRTAASAAGVQVVAVPRVTTSHVADHVLMRHEGRLLVAPPRPGARETTGARYLQRDAIADWRPSSRCTCPTRRSCGTSWTPASSGGWARGVS